MFIAVSPRQRAGIVLLTVCRVAPDLPELVLLVEDASTTSVKLSWADLHEGVAWFLLVLEDTSQMRAAMMIPMILVGRGRQAEGNGKAS